MVGLFLVSSCQKEELPSQEYTMEEISEVPLIKIEKEPIFINTFDILNKDYSNTCGGCTPNTGWDCTNYDHNNTPRDGADSHWWDGQIGFKKGITPVSYQMNAICESGWLGCSCDYDIRVYFDGGRDFSYFNDPSNSKNVFVRYNVAGNPGPGLSCTRRSKKPRIDYLTTNGPGPHPPGVSGDYIRVTIGQYCPTPIALVAE